MKKSIVMALGILTFSSFAFCVEGGANGGGGDVVILPDDSVVLADPWIDTGAVQPNNMPPLRSLNPRLLQSINSYTKVASNLIDDGDIYKLLTELAKRKNDLRFYGVQSVDELNNFCAPGGRKIYKLPDGASVQQIACTAGVETFFIEPLFARLNVREQTLLLMHERLTTLRDVNGGKNYSAIAQFTTGLGVYLNIYTEQSKGKYRALSESEQVKLTNFYTSTEEIEKRNSEISEDSFQLKAHVFGGGRVHESAEVDSSALVSLFSVVPKNSKVSANVKLINFNRKDTVEESFEIGAESEIKDSILFGKFIIGTNTKIIDSKLYKLESSKEKYVLKIGNNVEFNKGEFQYNNAYKKLTILDGEKLIDQHSSLKLSNRSYANEVNIIPVVARIKVATFICRSPDKIDKLFSYKFSIVNPTPVININSKVVGHGFADIKKYSIENTMVDIKLTSETVKIKDETASRLGLILTNEGRFARPVYYSEIKYSIPASRNTSENYLDSKFCIFENVIKAIKDQTGLTTKLTYSGNTIDVTIYPLISN